MRARLAIMAARKPVELREVVLRNKPQEMLDISPKGTVPVLQLADGSVIEQSLDIMFWALGDTLSEPQRGLIEENDTSFKAALDRYKYADRYPEFEQTHYREQGMQFLALLEQRLDPYLNGAQMGFTDWAIAPFVRQFAGVDRDWFAGIPLQRTRDWLAEFTDSELFAAVMQKYDPWVSGAPGVAFAA